MMKNKTLLTGKLAAVVLAAAMIFGVTACKGTAADTAEGTAAAESVTEAVPAALSTAAEETGTAVESREEAAEEATAEISVAEDPDTEIAEFRKDTAIKVTVEDQKEEKKNDAGEVLVTISVQKATIEDSGYDALQKVLDQQSSDTYELAQEAWGDMQAFLEDNDWETTGSLYGIEDTISMKRGDDRIFSYVTTDYSYLGGAHPNFVYNG